MLGNVAEEAGHNLERVARHQERLGKPEAARQIAEAGRTAPKHRQGHQDAACECHA